MFLLLCICFIARIFHLVTCDDFGGLPTSNLHRRAPNPEGHGPVRAVDNDAARGPPRAMAGIVAEHERTMQRIAHDRAQTARADRLERAHLNALGELKRHTVSWGIVPPAAVLAGMAPLYLQTHALHGVQRALGPALAQHQRDAAGLAHALQPQSPPPPPPHGGHSNPLAAAALEGLLAKHFVRGERLRGAQRAAATRLRRPWPGVHLPRPPDLTTGLHRQVERSLGRDRDLHALHAAARARQWRDALRRNDEFNRRLGHGGARLTGIPVPQEDLQKQRPGKKTGRARRREA